MDDVTKEEIIKEAIENARKEKKDKPSGGKAKKADKAEESKAEETVKEEAEDTAAEEAVEATEEAAEEEKAEASGEETSQKEEKKGLFKKKDNKDKERIEELEDKVKRQLAEFENFRNRTEKEKAQMYDMGAKNVLEKILPVIDNFERGLATVPEEDAGGAFAEGMNMIYKQLIAEMEKLGVEPIEAVGKEFDPNLHNAVMQVESEEYESGFVAQEMQKGYKYHDSVLRHSMVAVVP